MGILGLSRLIADICPEAIKELEIKSFFGRRIAIDASMSIYQFLIAIRSNHEMMTNSEGETTSHLVGLFYRTCKLLEAGVKPVYVFDGSAPQLKGKELDKRRKRREEATKSLAAAETAEDVAKFSKRLVRVTRQHNEECKKLLKLMGIPIICAPSEAEGQCAQLCKEGLVYAVATEDMDGLTFGSPRLIRNLSAGGSGEKCKEYVLEKVLEGLGLTYLQFVDLCILMGCDYCGSIRGIGGKKGLDLMKKYGSIEELLKEKYQITDFVDAEVAYNERKRNTLIEVDDDKESKEEEANNDAETKPDAEPNTKENVDNEVETESVPQEVKLEENGDEDQKQEEDITANGSQVSDKSEHSKGESDLEEAEELIKSDNDGKEDGTEVKAKKKSKKKQPRNPLDDVPQPWLFKGARKLFLEPNVTAGTFTEADVRLRDIDEDELVKFLCEEQGFSEDRVRSGIKRIKAAKGKSNQTRIDSFFATKPLPAGSKTGPVKAEKRPASGKASGGKRGKRPR